MRREANRRVGSRFVPACATVALTFVSSAAMADETTISRDGLLKFANVRVVDAQAPVAVTGTLQSGYRVYKDAGTGELRAPTAEEMQAVASERGSPQSDMQKSYTASGATKVVLDESFLQYSVVVRRPDGTLEEVCVTGADKANDVISAASRATRDEEERNVR